METKRQSKVSKLIQKELAEILRSSSFGLSNNAMITVSQVRISPDLSSAKTYLSIFTLGQSNSGKEAIDSKAHLLEKIKSHTNQIRKQLGLKVGKQLYSAEGPKILDRFHPNYYVSSTFRYEVSND